MKSKTRKGLWVIATSLVILVLLANGCAGHSRGWKEPRELTEVEKDRVVEIALNTPEALRKLETESKYETEVGWLAIVWNNSEWSALYHMDYKWEEDPNFQLLPESAVFYPAVTIRFGEPEHWLVTAAIDLDAEKVVLVHEYAAGEVPEAVTSEDKE